MRYLSEVDDVLKGEKLSIPKVKGLTLIDKGWVRSDGAILLNREGRLLAYYMFEFEREVE